MAVVPPRDASTLWPTGSTSSGLRRLSCNPVGHSAGFAAKQKSESGSPAWSTPATPNSQPRACGSAVVQVAVTTLPIVQPDVPGPESVFALTAIGAAPAATRLPDRVMVTRRVSQVNVDGEADKPVIPGAVALMVSATLVRQ